MYTSDTFFENIDGEVSFVPELPAPDRWEVNDTFLCSVDEVHTVSNVEPSGTQLTNKTQNGFGGTTTEDSPFIIQNNTADSVVLFGPAV